MSGHQIGRLAGYRRSFCIDMKSYRGSPEQPGLMMALDVGGSCEGIVYDLPPDDHRAQIERLLRREVPYRADMSFVHWVDVRTADGPRSALTFYASPRSAGYFVDLPWKSRPNALRLRRVTSAPMPLISTTPW
jgi:glutathione-specific gamma-glutamylcyclotransferase